MMLSASQAAKATGKSIPTITRAIKAGKLSATKNGEGWLIDTSELHRVFPMLPQPSNVTPDKLGVETPIATSVLEVEVKALRELIATLKEDRDDLREDRDRWRDMAETVTRQLPAPTQAVRQSWWPFGRK
jgi:excisionase family DNA binding protein